MTYVDVFCGTDRVRVVTEHCTLFVLNLLFRLKDCDKKRRLVWLKRSVSQRRHV